MLNYNANMEESYYILSSIFTVLYIFQSPLYMHLSHTCKAYSRCNKLQLYSTPEQKFSRSNCSIILCHARIFHYMREHCNDGHIRWLNKSELSYRTFEIGVSKLKPLWVETRLSRWPPKRNLMIPTPRRQKNEVKAVKDIAGTKNLFVLRSSSESAKQDIILLKITRLNLSIEVLSCCKNNALMRRNR